MVLRVVALSSGLSSEVEHTEASRFMRAKWLNFLTSFLLELECDLVLLLPIHPNVLATAQVVGF